MVTLLDEDFPGREAEFAPWVGDLYILPEWRRRRVGTKLLAACVAAGRALGLKSISLWCDVRTSCSVTQVNTCLCLSVPCSCLTGRGGEASLGWRFELYGSCSLALGSPVLLMLSSSEFAGDAVAVPVAVAASACLGLSSYMYMHIHNNITCEIAGSRRYFFLLPPTTEKNGAALLLARFENELPFFFASISITDHQYH